MSAAEAIKAIRSKGGQLWVESGTLHFKAPKGALAGEDIAGLRTFKDQIVELLELRSHSGAVPLSYSQLTHWNYLRTGKGTSVRDVAYAMRLRGDIDLARLRIALELIVRRHEALRTHLIIQDDVPLQEVRDAANVEIEIQALEWLPKPQRAATLQELIQRRMLEPVDLTTDLLFAVELFRLDSQDHVLLIAMEHLISDGYSLTILWRDLMSVYAQLVRGQNVSLPDIPLQFAEYARRQRENESSWVQRNLAFWNERRAALGRQRFPYEIISSGREGFLRGSVPLRIDRGLKTRLQGWCRAHRTTPVMAIFAAYAALVLRWCKVSETIIQYQVNGRDDPQVQNTIGYFASTLYLRVHLVGGDGFSELLAQITDEYCTAHEHADSGYLESQIPPPGFTYNTTFNWLPQGSIENDLTKVDGASDIPHCSAFLYEHPARTDCEFDFEPSIVLFECDAEIRGTVYFSLSRFSVQTIERFARNFQLFIQCLAAGSAVSIRDIQLQSPSEVSL